MKVALVSPYALDRPGGVQEQAAGLAQRLPELGVETVLIGPGTSDGSWVSVGRPTPLAANQAVAPLSLLPAVVARVREAVDGFDVVHVHEPLAPLVGPAAWLGLPQRTVGTFHASPGSRVSGLYRRARPLLRPLVDHLDVRTAVSRAAAAPVAPFARGLRIVPNAIEVAAFAPAEPKVPGRVVFVGRDEPRKGLDIVLNAWPKVVEATPEAELVIVGAYRGSGPAGTSFLGRVPESTKRAVVGSSTVLVAPNLGGESFGLVLLEGMAAGCAVVASDLPAFRDVAAGAAAYIPPGDVDGLAEAISTLVREPARAAARGEDALRRAMRFDWSNVLPRWLALYEQL